MDFSPEKSIGPQYIPRSAAARKKEVQFTWASSRSRPGLAREGGVIVLSHPLCGASHSVQSRCSISFPYPMIPSHGPSSNRFKSAFAGEGARARARCYSTSEWRERGKLRLLPSAMKIDQRARSRESAVPLGLRKIIRCLLTLRDVCARERLFFVYHFLIFLFCFFDKNLDVFLILISRLINRTFQNSSLNHLSLYTLIIIDKEWFLLDFYREMKT